MFEPNNEVLLQNRNGVEISEGPCANCDRVKVAQWREGVSTGPGSKGVPPGQAPQPQPVPARPGPPSPSPGGGPEDRMGFNRKTKAML